MNIHDEGISAQQHVNFATPGELDFRSNLFFIPDGFSPNGDGVNDNYFIPYIEYFYPKYTYEIFNRYGQSLFRGDIMEKSKSLRALKTRYVF